MFITHKITGFDNPMAARKDALAQKAKAAGLVFGSYLYMGRGYGKNAIGGNTFSVKDLLKVAGARFAGDSKVWTFETIEQAEAAIDACINAA
jgi:hypothetical protein